jgi:hypothetical protein
MPPVISAIQGIVLLAKAYVGAALISVGVGASTAAAIAGFVVNGLIHAAVGAIFRAVAPKPKAGSIDQGRELALKFDPAYPREIMVGKCGTGGSLVYATTSGTNNVYLWRVIVLSDCVIEQIDEVWGNGEKLTFSGDWHTGYASCTSHFKSAGGASRLQVRIYKGDQTAVDSSLTAAAPTEWVSNCIGKGVAYAIARFEYDADAFQTGEPGLFFVGRGAKVRDPRTGTTIYSANAALVGAQFLRGFSINSVRVLGLGAAAADIPDTELTDAADLCDEDVALYAGGVENRYEVHGVISAQSDAQSVLGEIVSSMAGLHIDRGGEIVLLPGAARAAVFDLTDADFLADVAVNYTDRVTADQLVNTIVSTFVDPTAAWSEQALPVRKDTAAITHDGERYEDPRSYRMVTSSTHGQRLDEIALRQARRQGRLSFGLPLYGIEAEPGDWITVTSRRWGGGTKAFWIARTDLAFAVGDGGDASARVLFECVETADSVYTWSTSDEISYTRATVARPSVTLAITNLAISPVLQAAGSVTAAELQISWDAIANPAADTVEIEYKVDGQSMIYRAAAGADQTSTRVQQGIYAGAVYTARARLRAGDRVGDWTSWTATGTTGTSVAIVSPTFLYASRAGAGSVTTGLATVSASFGVSPYSHRWEKVSGSTLTVTSPAAPATTFSATLGATETLDAIYRCTITDAAGRTAFVEVRVELESATSAPYGVGASPSAVYGGYLGSSTVTTNAVTVTPTGGTAPYTYAWAYVSGDTFTIDASTAATTTFTRTVGSSTMYSAVYRCTVTDAAAATATIDVTVTAWGPFV